MEEEEEGKDHHFSCLTAALDTLPGFSYLRDEGTDAQEINNFAQG